MLEPRGTVVFLGAGASKAFGLPLTNEILPQMVARLRGSSQDPPLFGGPRQAQLAAEFRAVLHVLYPGLDIEGSGNELPNITNVLSFIDHLILYDYPAALGFGKERLVQGRRLFERGMMEVLLDGDLSPILDQLQDRQDYSLKDRELPAIERRMTAAEKETLESFLRWLGEQKGGEPLTVITTNYDVAVETPLFASIGLDAVSGAIDFGFDWRDPYRERLVPRPADPQIAILKLHGSLNWLRCDLCGQVYVNPREVIAYLSFNERQSWPNTCECGAWPLRHLIVAPSMVRDVRDPHLLNVWRSATEALRTAKRWFLIGYSLPAEDLAIRSMLLRAYGARGLQAGPTPLAARPPMPSPHVTVVQRGDAARAAYASLFGKFDYIAGGLEALLQAASTPGSGLPVPNGRAAE